MKKIVLKTYTKIIAWALTMLGLYSSCDIIQPKVEYGTPSADFKAKGAVTEAQSNRPIPNIRVVRRALYPIDRPSKLDTTFTNEKGEYAFESQKIIGFPVKIYAEDLDGEKNLGAFRKDSILIEEKDTRLIKKGSNWFKGAFEKTDANIKMKPQIEAMYGVLSTDYKEINNPEQ